MHQTAEGKDRKKGIPKNRCSVKIQWTLATSSAAP